MKVKEENSKLKWIKDVPNELYYILIITFLAPIAVFYMYQIILLKENIKEDIRRLSSTEINKEKRLLDNIKKDENLTLICNNQILKRFKIVQIKDNLFVELNSRNRYHLMDCEIYKQVLYKKNKVHPYISKKDCQETETLRILIAKANAKNVNLENKITDLNKEISKLKNINIALNNQLLAMQQYKKLYEEYKGLVKSSMVNNSEDSLLGLIKFKDKCSEENKALKYELVKIRADLKLEKDKIAILNVKINKVIGLKILEIFRQYLIKRINYNKFERIVINKEDLNKNYDIRLDADRYIKLFKSIIKDRNLYNLYENNLREELKRINDVFDDGK